MGGILTSPTRGEVTCPKSLQVHTKTKHTETLKDPKKQRHTKTIQADADKHTQVQILRCVAQGNVINHKVDTFYARNSERKLIVND